VRAGSGNTSEMKIFRYDHILRKRIFVIHLQIEQFFINRAEHFYGNRQIFEFVFCGQNPLLVIFVTDSHCCREKLQIWIRKNYCSFHNFNPNKCTHRELREANTPFQYAFYKNIYITLLMYL
jgi:hypothetical protein